MGAGDVAAILIAYGRELESQGAAQVGSAFTTDESANALIESSPDAFLLGVLFTQGIPAERAWSAPAELRTRLGTLDMGFLAEHPAEVRAAVQRAPMLHRFKETLPRWIVAAAQRVQCEYGGDTTRIWAPGSHVREVTDRLSSFPGIGRKKAVMATEILMRHFGVDLGGREHGQVAFDVQVRRVFLRSGLAQEDSIAAIEAAAARWCPDSPGTMDLPAWLIGRQWCRPKAPKCEECRLGTVCPRRVQLNPTGVGSTSAHSAERSTSPESSFG
ncbi:MAG: hypothetical protein U1E26_04870 [Coriobacteriia bacterium]|nr:hypothetical protein [Coriobacteriia bacterium]